MEPMIGNGEWARELCRAFGENPDQCCRMVLDVRANSVVTVEIHKFVDKKNSDVIEIIRKVAWVKEDEDSEVLSERQETIPNP